MVISVVVIAVSLCWQNLVRVGDAFSLLWNGNGDCLFCLSKSSAKNASHALHGQARNHFRRRQRPAKAIAPFCFCDCIYEIHRWSIAHKLFLRAWFVSVPKCTPYKKSVQLDIMHNTIRSFIRCHGLLTAVVKWAMAGYVCDESDRIVGAQSINRNQQLAICRSRTQIQNLPLSVPFCASPIQM